jgi:AraC-like DNA-binding protein
MKTQLTTASVQPRQRFRFWQDAVCDAFVQIDCRKLSDRPFAGELATGSLDSFRISSVVSGDHEVTRTPSRIRQGREEILLVSAMLEGRGVFSQDGRETCLGAGDFVCYDSTRPYCLRFDGDFRQVVVQMPRDLVTRYVGRTELLTARAIRHDSPMGGLVFPFLERMASTILSFETVTANRLSDVMLALLTTAFGELACQDCLPQSTARTALLYRAKAFVCENLHEFDLNTKQIAGHLQISERYLQELFHADGTTVNDWIWSRRLEKCRRDLSGPIRAGESISRIATSAGFSDFAHFSRRFKKAFGQSPRDFRRSI